MTTMQRREHSLAAKETCWTCHIPRPTANAFHERAFLEAPVAMMVAVSCPQCRNLRNALHLKWRKVIEEPEMSPLESNIQNTSATQTRIATQGLGFGCAITICNSDRGMNDTKSHKQQINKLDSNDWLLRVITRPYAPEHTYNGQPHLIHS